jgi:hypothetical protein
MDYREYLERHILAPLGMKSSTLEPSAVPARLRAIGYRKTGDQYSEEPSLAHGSFGAMGGLHTSARDLARYVAFHLSAWPPRDEDERGPVRRSSVREMNGLWRTATFSADRPSPDAPLRAVTGGYGYGLAVSRDCRFAHIVGHGGGRPGFGSYMMWLPEHSVGIFAMANLTYTGPRAAADDGFNALRKTGALRPRELPPAPLLVSTRDAIVRLWRRWDDREAQNLAANNLFLDIPAARRKKEIAEMQTASGECGQVGDVAPENLLRGSFRMQCERGFVEATFTLAPTIPPKVQHLRFTHAAPLEPAMKAAAESLTKKAPPPYGACRLGEALSGNGKTTARLRLDCARGPLDLQLRLGDDGKLRESTFAKPPGEACIQ